MQKDIKELLQFIQSSPSPFHTVETAGKMLEDAGFTELDMASVWSLDPGGRYFVRVYGSTLLAFAVGEKEGPLRLAAAHTDFPCFRLKPQAGIRKEGYGLLNVEKYGGMMLRTWLDRPLGLAGKVVLRSEDVFAPAVRLVNFPKPLLTIPSLAIHMDREVNDEGKLNPQTDMLPIAAMSGEELTESFFLDWLANELSISPEDILSYELSAYPFEKGCLCGLQEEFLSSPRLDNLTSTLACLKGLMSAEPKAFSGLRLTALFDNEEVGSGTKQGADSSFLADTLHRICLALGRDSGYRRTLAASFLISADNAHAVHPNHPEYADRNDRPEMNKGIVIKYNASQKYTTDAVSAAVFAELCRRCGVPTQRYTNRADLAGGSTLGHISTAHVSVDSLDIGLAQLAMHSAYETAGALDTEYLIRAAAAFYGSAYRKTPEGIEI